MAAVLALYSLLSFADAATRPKAIVLMLGDDYGYNNVGFAHGPDGNNGNPEMRTPKMDDLARSGIILDRFYTYKVRKKSTTFILCDA
jgi:arylsulfatase A-like enzyme